MQKSSFAMLLAASLLAGASAATAAPAYHLAETIPLGGDVKWDYLYRDPSSGHLFISHGSELTVVDPKAGEVIGHVAGLQGSHGIAIDPETGLGYADSAKTQTVSVFNVKSLQVAKELPALEDADGMVYDPASRQVFIAGGDANAVLPIDAAKNQAGKLIPLGGAPEFLVVDAEGDLFVNIKDRNQIVRIDTKTDTVTARWTLPGCDGPTGLAIDPVSQRLFSSCENAKMAVVDARNGEVVALLPIGKGSDAARFDAGRKLVFSSNRDGSLSMIRELGADHFIVMPPLQTAPGARTMEIDPVSGDVFLVTADVLSILPPPAPNKPPRYSFKPGTAKLLVYQPASMGAP
ncbi:YncE family protein [Acidocella aromatica]|uniref:DNA-binding beta-propeller fold protein YncE n=1 Tax=Acidocella aromatica TaxID=1303579 RepID=A0A840VCM3_9PROT|nr:YncE family protein [Acidocella aromatica]MBB5373424.1 DNA-binding beta-propeller fold protein YncE [Acidocella aromatica]